MLLGEVGQLRDRVEPARVHLARVRDQDRRHVERVEAVTQPVDVQATCAVAGQDLHVSPAEPEHPERQYRSGVHVTARQDDRCGKLG